MFKNKIRISCKMVEKHDVFGVLSYVLSELYISSVGDDAKAIDEIVKMYEFKVKNAAALDYIAETVCGMQSFAPPDEMVTETLQKFSNTYLLTEPGEQLNPALSSIVSISTKEHARRTGKNIESYISTIESVLPKFKIAGLN